MDVQNTCVLGVCSKKVSLRSVNKVSNKLGVLRRLRIPIPMAAAERPYKTMILPIFVSLQHGSAKFIFPNSGRDAKELNAALDLVPLINRRKLHIAVLTRKCLDGLVPPYLINYFTLNTSVHIFTTRRCDDIHILKVNLEVAK